MKAFFKIIRWQNLLFIVVAQLLFYYCILIPEFESINEKPTITSKLLWFIITASVCIAASGNIINDYFDLNIDRINKPSKLIIEKYISRRLAIFLHLLISSIGIILSFYVAHCLNIFWFGLANTISVLLLFIYSASLKKKFLIGNIVVSGLTSWVILVLALPETLYLLKDNLVKTEMLDKLFRLAILYASFSFIISLIREVVKDMEDVDGDRKNGCKTMPIVWGFNVTKAFVFVWIIVLISILAVAQIYVLKYGWWHSILYALFFLLMPLIFLFKKLMKANNSNDFSRISSSLKWIMLAGIFSMIFFKFYTLF